MIVHADYLTAAIDGAVSKAFVEGLFQHRAEIVSFLEWFCTEVQRPDDRIGPVLEIGAHRGGSAVLFCELGATQVLSVDDPDGPWGGVGRPSAESRDRALKARYPAYVPIWGDSHHAATFARVADALGGAQVDLLFIDGDHSATGCRRDYELYAPFVRPGGAIAFHDINETQLHRDRGVMVSRVWRGLEGDKREFTIGADWGGIGALRVPA